MTHDIAFIHNLHSTIFILKRFYAPIEHFNVRIYILLYLY